MLRTEISDNDLIVTFDGKGNGLSDDNFAAKLLGKTKSGDLLFGYSRLPGVNYIEPALSAKLPTFYSTSTGYNIEVEVQNFGQVSSKKAKLKIWNKSQDEDSIIAEGEISALNPFEKTLVNLKCGDLFKEKVKYIIEVIIESEGQKPVSLNGSVAPNE